MLNYLLATQHQLLHVPQVQCVSVCMCYFTSSPSFSHQELASLRQKLSATVSGSLEVDLTTQLDSRFEAAIDELREKSELEIAQYKMEIEESYRDKV